MLLLGIDCSHSSGSICIQKSDSILFHKEWSQQKSHAEFITQVLSNAFKTLKISIKDFTAICVNEGPGSFTGLRIAVNTARTLAFTENTPIYPFNSLEITAHLIPRDSKNLLVALNAHSGMCFLQEFIWKTHWEPFSEIRVLEAREVKTNYNLNNLLCAGEGFEVYSNLILDSNAVENPLYKLLPNSISLNDLYLKTQGNRPKITWKDLQPFYVRLSAPEEKANLKKNSSN